MGIWSYFVKKISTVKKLFYYHIVIKGLRQKSRILKHFSRPHTNYDLVIIDDLVPKSVSGFRNYEFSYLLNHIQNSALYSIIGNKYTQKRPLEFFQIKNTNEFYTGKHLFCRKNGISSDKIRPFFPWTNINAKLVYIVFVTNADYLIDYLEERKLRFILELYPGGSFSVLTEGPGFERLKRILGSVYLEKVIVTQKITQKFIIENNLCDKSRMVFKYGATLSPEMLNVPAKKIRYGMNKNTIDICFTSAKYMPKGPDKGYDIFIDLAHLLLSKSNIYRFHIVGGFNKDDIEIDYEYINFFNFYGFLQNEQFIKFYEDKDIFISPSRAFVLGKGSFDGFPTASCSEASLNGLCMIVSDPLALNICYSNKEDILLVENNPAQFAEIIINLANNPSEIYRIGEKGKITTRNINKDHGEFRVSLVNELLHNND